ncbi:hypothetical protein [Nocardioides sp. B-3]|uniref:hypothetical protein n=1 Tax=Nocardioides sp. B-3 TaxID=2895565 RepID=UPI002152CB15|nr:hypothetical protein [Nocardioides sp. B-3]UUZ59691.1 hypothetical protein LP418_00655 [Nocardioides sp. B-3]
MDQRTIDQLEHDLHGHDPRDAAGPDLATIRSLGSRRRRARGLPAGGGSVAAVVALGLVLSTVAGGSDRATDDPRIRDGADHDADGALPAGRTGAGRGARRHAGLRLAGRHPRPRATSRGA